MRPRVSRCAPIGQCSGRGDCVLSDELLWPIVHQPFSESESFPLALIYRNYGGTRGRYTQPYASANLPEGAQFFGDAVATRGGDAAELDDFVAYQP